MSESGAHIRNASETLTGGERTTRNGAGRRRGGRWWSNQHREARPFSGDHGQGASSASRGQTPHGDQRGSWNLAYPRRHHRGVGGGVVRADSAERVRRPGRGDRLHNQRVGTGHQQFAGCACISVLDAGHAAPDRRGDHRPAVRVDLLQAAPTGTDRQAVRLSVRRDS